MNRIQIAIRAVESNNFAHIHKNLRYIGNRVKTKKNHDTMLQLTGMF